LNPKSLIKALRETDDYIEKIYLNGGCYQFYKFLKAVYPKAVPYLSQDKQHVVTKICSCFYDITGRVSGRFHILMEMSDIKMCEKWSFCKNNWLFRDCPNCGEYVSA